MGSWTRRARKLNASAGRIPYSTAVLKLLTAHIRRSVVHAEPQHLLYTLILSDYATCSAVRLELHALFHMASRPKLLRTVSFGQDSWPSVGGHYLRYVTR